MNVARHKVTATYVLAAALLGLATAVVYFTIELSRYREYAPELLAQSASWQERTIALQGRLDRALILSEQALATTDSALRESARLRASVSPVLAEIARSRETVHAMLPRVDEALARVRSIEQEVPSALATANAATREAQRVNDALPAVLQEVRTTRREAAVLLAEAERIVEKSRTAGKQASEGAVAGVFTGVLKLPRLAVSRVTRAASQASGLDRELSDKDRELLSDASEEALREATPGKAHSWRNEQTGNRGTVSTARIYLRDGRTCQQLAYDVTLHHGKHSSSKVECCQTENGEWETLAALQR